MNNSDEQLGHAVNISHSDGKPTRDMNAKRIFQFRQVLSLILKETVSEFENLSLDEIEELVPANAANPCLVDALPEAPISSQEAPISFDLRFLTKTTEKLKFSVYVDIEPQNRYMRRSGDDTSGYDLPARAEYYVSKMLTSQLDACTRIDYNSLCKCYSIWFCFDSVTGRRSAKIPSSFSTYGMEPRKLYGKTQEEVERERNLMDLVEVQIYRIGAYEEDQPDILRFIYSLFSNPEKIGDYINIKNPDYESILKEAKSMCDLSVLYIEQGKEQGIEQGIKQGMEQGIKQGIKQGMEQGIKQGMEQGIKQGMEQGIKQGIGQGKEQGIRNTVTALKNAKMPTKFILEQLCLLYNLSEEECKPYFDDLTIKQ